MKKKEKQNLIVIAILVLTAVGVIVFSESVQKDKQEEPLQSVSQSDIQNKVDFKKEMMYDEYDVDEYKVNLKSDSGYSIQPKSNPENCIFTGPFKVIQTDEAIKKKIVTKKELKKAGLTSEQISSKQTVIVQLQYQEHHFHQTTEYFVDDLSNKSNGFIFALVFENNKKALYDVTGILKSIDISTYYF